ncbi:MAG TPA: diacylglycerol kinase family protein [Candidatus Onthousia faecigallinarum]|nr:diacylglycerol kinase family protein [Candidatus Onthousia faecigallinarum]
MDSKDKKTVYTKDLGKSLNHSLDGLILAVKKESSLKILIGVALLVLMLGVLFQVSAVDWLFILLMIGCCFGAELFNTAIESVVDLATQEIHPLAKAAKDTASAAELVFLVMSAIMLCIIFIPEVMTLFEMA